jgi:hypothetical protein
VAREAFKYYLASTCMKDLDTGRIRVMIRLGVNRGNASHVTVSRLPEAVHTDLKPGPGGLVTVAGHGH